MRDMLSALLHFSIGSFYLYYIPVKGDGKSVSTGQFFNNVAIDNGALNDALDVVGEY